MEDFASPVRGNRTFAASRRVRWGDADPSGRLRLDSLLRYLQDVSNDDTRDAGADPAAPWVVRRTRVRVESPIRLGEMVELTTFCGGVGSRWAERRTTLHSERGGHIEAASLWVFLDSRGRPAKLPAEFLDTWGAGEREVGARLRHEPPPDAAASRAWVLRSTDLDMLNHVNNAATWEAVEDECTRRGVVPRAVELEHRDAIAPEDDVELRSVMTDAGMNMWLLTSDGTIRASAVVVA
ncbi:MAG: acyl-[acyl-carrier-protein] thioesterase [Acidimicrobiia bacterium]